MSIENHVEALRREHRRIDESVARLEAAPSSDSLEIARLKREKLQIKDRIEAIGGDTRH